MQDEPLYILRVPVCHQQIHTVLYSKKGSRPISPSRESGQVVPEEGHFSTGKSTKKRAAQLLGQRAFLKWWRRRESNL